MGRMLVVIGRNVMRCWMAVVVSEDLGVCVRRALLMFVLRLM